MRESCGYRYDEGGVEERRVGVGSEFDILFMLN